MAQAKLWLCSLYVPIASMCFCVQRAMFPLQSHVRSAVGVCTSTSALRLGLYGLIRRRRGCGHAHIGVAHALHLARQNLGGLIFREDADTEAVCSRGALWCRKVGPVVAQYSAVVFTSRPCEARTMTPIGNARRVVHHHHVLVGLVERERRRESEGGGEIDITGALPVWGVAVFAVPSVLTASSRRLSRSAVASSGIRDPSIIIMSHTLPDWASFGTII